MANPTRLILWLLTLSLSTAHADPDRCVLCHGNQAPPRFGSRAPLLRDQFRMDWDMFEFPSDQRPPFSVIPTPHSVIHGHTYYDWQVRSMTEIYTDKCIDIFPSGRDFPCQFLSVGPRTFFITFRAGLSAPPDSCCLWRSSEFWAPRPDVLQTMVFDTTLALDQKKADWWTLDIPMPGPFGYGVYRNPERPAAFWFPVISGWVQQNFSRFRAEKPDPEIFVPPDRCQGQLPVCPEN